MVAHTAFRRFARGVIWKTILVANGSTRYPSLAEEYPLFNRLPHALSELP
jgi:hypothetical protein